MKKIPHKMDPALACRARGLNSAQLRMLGNIYRGLGRHLMRSARQMRSLQRSGRN